MEALVKELFALLLTRDESNPGIDSPCNGTVLSRGIDEEEEFSMRSGRFDPIASKIGAYRRQPSLILQTTANKGDEFDSIRGPLER